MIVSLPVRLFSFYVLSALLKCDLEQGGLVAKITMVLELLSEWLDRPKARCALSNRN